MSRPLEKELDQARHSNSADATSSDDCDISVDLAHAEALVRCTSAAADKQTTSACVSTIGQAFAGYAYIQHVFNITAGCEPTLLAGMSRVYLDRFPAAPLLYHTEDCNSAAIVYTNEQSDILDNQFSLRVIPGLLQVLRVLSMWHLPKLAPVVGNMSKAGAALMAMVTADRSTSRYLKLIVIATQPKMQRQGLGTAVLAAVTADADREQLPIYLEAIEHAHVHWYERHGFKIADQCDVSEGVQGAEQRVVQLMVRMPQPHSS